MLSPVKTQPADVLLDGMDELDILLAGIGIIEAQVAHGAEVGVFLGYAEIEANCFGMTDVQVAVRFRRKACDGRLAMPRGQIPGDPLAYEVSFLLSCHARDSTLFNRENQDFSSKMTGKKAPSAILSSA